MCDPISLVSLAVGAATSVVQYQGQVAAADQQNEMYRENAARANQNARDEYVQTQQRMLQEQESGAEQKADNLRDARAAKATATVAAGESGVSGLSVDALLREFDGRAATANDRIDENTDWTLTQLNNEMKGIQSQTEDRINSVQRAAKPSFFDAGLRILGNGLSSYKTHMDYQTKLTSRGT